MVLTTYPARSETPERLVAGGFVRQANRDATLFFVRSIENPLHDYVVRAREQVACDCQDYARQGNCSHAVAVRAVLVRQSSQRGQP